MLDIRLAGIIHESTVNGAGIRRVFFSQGCTHNCKGCFNKHTHSFESGSYYIIDKLVEEVVESSYLSGVTFSGGDPLEQPEEFTYFSKKLKEHGINIWCYTGYTWEEILKKDELKELISNIDVLVDGEFVVELEDCNLLYRGSSNQRIIDVKESLNKNRVVLWK